MISYNQHRKKWQRGCPCNLLINIFDKVSYYLITPHGKYEVKQRKFVKEEKKVKEEKNLWTKNQKFDISKKVFWLIFLSIPQQFDGENNEVKENLWTKKDLWTEKKKCENKEVICENKEVICEKPTGSKTLSSLKKKFFGFFFSLSTSFLDEKTQCWRPRRPHTI